MSSTCILHNVFPSHELLSLIIIFVTVASGTRGMNPIAVTLNQSSGKKNGQAGNWTSNLLFLYTVFYQLSFVTRVQQVQVWDVLELPHVRYIECAWKTDCLDFVRPANRFVMEGKRTKHLMTLKTLTIGLWSVWVTQSLYIKQTYLFILCDGNFLTFWKLPTGRMDITGHRRTRSGFTG